VSDDGVAALGGALAGTLRSLVLDSCSDVTSDGLKALTRFGQMDSLSLNDCWQVTDAGLREVATVTTLTSLSLKNLAQVRAGALLDVRPRTREAPWRAWHKPACAANVSPRLN
jgi:hypothetical protein